MYVIESVAKFIDTINNFIGKLIAFLLIPGICIATYEVIARYFFGAPTIWAWEMNLQLWAGIVLLCGGYVMLKDGHVRVDVLYNMFNKNIRAILNIISCLLIMSCMILIIKYGFDLGIASLLKDERQATVWGSPMWTIRMLIPIGGILLFMQGLSEIIKSILILMGDELKPDDELSAGEVQ